MVGRDKHDEESTPLLVDIQSTTANTQNSTANSKYGSTASTATGGTSSENVDLDSEAQTLKEEDKFQHIEKRLKDDGNWWTYAKGFSVSHRSEDDPITTHISLVYTVARARCMWLIAVFSGFFALRLAYKTVFHPALYGRRGALPIVHTCG